VSDKLLYGSNHLDFHRLDTSGVCTEREVKGWLYDSPSRRIVVVSAHTGPVIGSPVTMIDPSGVRHHFKLADVRYPIFQVIKDRKPTPMQPDDLFAGDITIGVLDRPAPAGLKAYRLASKTVEREWIAVQNQELMISMGRLITREGAAIASLKDSEIVMIPGDSGLPWFNGRNEVVSHNTLGGDGHGPLYSHLFLQKKLGNELDALENTLEK
jgi:hypothetical protein